MFPIQLEFIGPSGVGKTHLRDAVVSQLSQNYALAPPDFPILNHNSFPNSRHYSLLQMKAANIGARQRLNSVQRTVLLRYFSDIALRDITIQFLSTGEAFLLDEGLVHNFAAELLALEQSVLKQLLVQRALIYLRPSRIQTVVDRVRLRSLSGALVTHHQGLDDSELAAIAQESVDRFDEVSRLGQEIGVPILKLNAESDLSHNIAAILKFEGDLLGRG